MEKKSWSWLPQRMPGVAALIAEKRLSLGAAHVALCWQRGVLEQQPGWFYARENALAVGTPWNDPEMACFSRLSVTTTQALLVLRPVGLAATKGV